MFDRLCNIDGLALRDTTRYKSDTLLLIDAHDSLRFHWYYFQADCSSSTVVIAK